MHGRWFVSCELFAGRDFQDYADEKGKIVCVDIRGGLIDGRELSIECKKGGWKKPTTPLEKKQAKALELVRSSGGVAGFVTSISDVSDLLDSAFDKDA